MKRVIIHWTAGQYKPSQDDLGHYHFVIDGDGSVISGKLPVEANKAPMGKVYAAHTLNCNSDSIGVAIAAMAGARERPFDAGPAPIKEIQLDALAELVAGLRKQYGIAISRETILTHAEVQPTLKIAQKGKWDITWLPHLAAPIDPVAAGDMLRGRVYYAMAPSARPAQQKAPPIATKPIAVPMPAPEAQSSWAAIFRGVLAMFSRNTSK
jgi:hypothetical protein